MSRGNGVQEGLLLCNAMHITASVFINDDESGLHHDFDVWLEKLALTSLFPGIATMWERITPTAILSDLLWGGRSL